MRKRTGSNMHVIQHSSGYLVLIVIIFIIWLCWRSTVNRRLMNPAQATIILALLPLCLANTNFPSLTISQSAEEATIDIIEIQKAIKRDSCNGWSLFSEHQHWGEWEQGFHPVSTACALASINITCPCSPANEYIPLTSKPWKETKGYHDDQCPDNKLAHKFAVERDRFQLVEAVLCTTGDSSWWRKYFSQLLGSACVLSRKAYNCQCGGKILHKPIFRDTLTMAAMESVQNHMTERSADCDRRDEIQSVINQKNGNITLRQNVQRRLMMGVLLLYTCY